MKRKIVCVVLLCLSVICSLAIFTACPEATPTEKRIALTMDNYTQYLAVDCDLIGGSSGMKWDSSINDYKYKIVESHVNVKAVSSNLRFEGCTIELGIEGVYVGDLLGSEYTWKYFYLHTVEIGTDGSGADVNGKYSNSYVYKINYNGFNVTNITGYVIVG